MTAVRAKAPGWQDQPNALRNVRYAGDDPW